MLFTILLAAAPAADDWARFQRYERWAKEARIDLCAEAIIWCRNDGMAERMADLLLPLRKWPFAQPENPRGPKYFGPVFERSRLDTRKHDHYKGESVFVPQTGSSDDRTGLVLVRADRCAVQEINRGNYFVAVRDQITKKFRLGLEDYKGEWYNSVVITGSSASVPRVDFSLIICDGDLKVTSLTNMSVIIANGNIDCDSHVDHTNLYAAGKINASKRHAYTCEVHEDGKNMPVRFLDLGRDLGLRVTGKLELDDDWRGLRKGDTIAKIDGAAVDSVPALRKQLRRGIVRGGAAVEARRGNEVVALTVRLDLDPIPLAPPPREKK
jgi:hypothetical protein